MAGFLRAQDAISGQEGRAYLTLDNRNYEMFYIKTLEASVEKNKSEVRTLGRRGVQHKTTGWTGTGTMTIYYVTSFFRQIMYEYIKSGKDAYFDVTITNEDPSSSIGAQTVTLKGVNLDSVIMAALDTESEALEEEVVFTFEDVDLGQTFQEPVLGS